MTSVGVEAISSIDKATGPCRRGDASIAGKPRRNGLKWRARCCGRRRWPGFGLCVEQRARAPGWRLARHLRRRIRLQYRVYAAVDGFDVSVSRAGVRKKGGRRRRRRQRGVDAQRGAVGASEEGEEGVGASGHGVDGESRKESDDAENGGRCVRRREQGRARAGRRKQLSNSSHPSGPSG